MTTKLLNRPYGDALSGPLGRHAVILLNRPYGDARGLGAYENG